MAYLDAFTDTTGTNLESHNQSGVWFKLLSNASMVITSNYVRGGGSENYYYHTQTYATAHYSKATVLTDGNDYIGVMVRAQAGTSNTFTGIIAWAHSATVVYGSLISGSWTSGGTISVDPTAQTLELRCDASDATKYYIFIAGVQQASWTVATIAGGRAGIGNGGSNSTVQRLDDWEGGDVGAAAGPVIPVFLNQYGQRRA